MERRDGRSGKAFQGGGLWNAKVKEEPSRAGAGRGDSKCEVPGRPELTRLRNRGRKGSVPAAR